MVMGSINMAKTLRLTTDTNDKQQTTLHHNARHTEQIHGKTPSYSFQKSKIKQITTTHQEHSLSFLLLSTITKVPHIDASTDEPFDRKIRPCTEPERPHS